MERQAFERYSTLFVQALAAFDDVMGVAALGSTADPQTVDCWFDHDFAIVLRNGSPDQFLNDVSWMPEAKRIIASARHGGIYNVAVYDDGHKVEYLVCNEPAISSITVTKSYIFLDRSEVGKRIEEARLFTSVRHRAMAEQPCDPVNLAIVILTAGQRVRRGEVLSAISLVAAATDMALHMLGKAPATPELTDPLDPRRRLELLRPDIAKELSDLLTSPPDVTIYRLLRLVDAIVRPKTPSLNWSGFDEVVRRLPP